MADRGLICCFDILGYQNIIKTNQIEYVSNLISEKICTLPQDALQITNRDLKSVFTNFGYKDEQADAFASINSNINYLSISDTLLVSLNMNKIMSQAELDDKIKSAFEITFWVLFLVRVATLQRLYFDAGLPMRGAIDYGDFYIHDNNFAGKPIIDSYSLSQKLNFSGCVLTPKTGQFLLSKVGEWSVLTQKDLFDVFKTITLPYLAPLKDSSYSKLLVLDWLHVNNTTNTMIPEDITQFTNTAFHDHNKEIDESVIPKIDNTERILRWMKERKWGLNKDSLMQNIL